MLKEYSNIAKQLQEELLDENKSVLYTDLSNLIIKIADHVFADNEKIKKGVADIMGGKVLQLESERIEENRNKTIAEMMLKDNEPIEKIVRYTQLPIDKIKLLKEDL